MELQVGKKLLAKAPPVHPNPDPPPIKATIKGYGVAAYRRASTNQEAAATSSAKISICKTVKLSGQQSAWPGQQRHQHTHTHQFLILEQCIISGFFCSVQEWKLQEKIP